MPCRALQRVSTKEQKHRHCRCRHAHLHHLLPPVNKFSLYILYRSLCLGLLTLQTYTVSTYGCGVPWDVPKSHYEGVDFQGHVHIVEELSRIDMGESGENLPLFFILNSSARYSSATGIAEIPLLQSRIIQLDESTFLCKSPSGWLLPFTRTASDKNILSGPLGMLATVSDNEIVVSAECGLRMKFEKGRITELKTGKTTLHYRYAGNRVSEISNGSNLVMQVVYEGDGEEISSLKLAGNESVEFRWASMPQVQSVSGNRLIGQTQRVISQITFPTGIKKTFEFGVDEEMRQTLNIDNTQRYAWAPETELITSDSGWTYEVTPGKFRFSHASIGRVNSAGEKEFWHNDKESGVEKVVKNGITETTRRFVGGIFDGQIRSKERLDAEGKLERSQYSYDQSGRLARLVEPDNSIKTFAYDESGRIVGIRHNEHQVFQQAFDDKGRPKQVTRADRTEYFFYKEDFEFGNTLSLFPPVVFQDIIADVASVRKIQTKNGPPLFAFANNEGKSLAICTADEIILPAASNRERKVYKIK